MKSHRLAAAALAALIGTAGVFFGSMLGSPAQTDAPDSVVALVADSQGLSLVPPTELPSLGTYWVVQSSLPCAFPPPDAVPAA